MATQAHCVYCFNSLYDKLTEQNPTIRLSYTQVQALWTKYNDPRSDPQDESHETDSLTDAEAASAQLESEARQASSSDDPPAQNHTSPPLSLPPSSTFLAPPSTSSPANRSLSSTPSSDQSRPKSRLASLFSSNSRSASTDSSSTDSPPPPRPGQDRGAARYNPRDRWNDSWAEPESNDDLLLEEPSPLFVTWNIVGPGDTEKSLRGCIGTFEPQRLDEGLRDYAITSALRDTRFHPISLSELPRLSVHVTLLTNFEPSAHPLDWTLGEHGIRLSFTYHLRRYNATYLPDVAVEQGWSKEETIVSLMRKAGWNGRKDEWKRVEGLKVVRYKGEKVGVGYAEWREWRDWVEKLDLGGKGAEKGVKTADSNRWGW